MQSKVSHSEKRVLIEGVAPLQWGKGMDTSFIRSCQVALNAMGEHLSYDYLMGISGAAFRFHFHPEWCPSAADVTTGFSVAPVMFELLGYRYELHRIDDSSFLDIRDLYQKIIAQVDAGMPVVAINLRVCPEWGVIAGYLKGQPGMLCRTYFDDSDAYTLAEHAPWLSFFIHEKSKAPAQEAVFRNSLEMAVRLAETGHFDNYFSGFHAIEKWIGELKSYIRSDRHRRFEEHEVNLTLFISLLDTRRAAARFLTSMSDLMVRAGPIIHTYQQEVELLEEGQQNILPAFEADAARWTQEVIGQQIEILTKVYRLEKEAIALIQEELKN